MSEEFVVMRARKEIRDKILDLAKKRNQTLTAVTDRALKEFLENNEYNFEDFLKIVETIPSLNLHKEMIKKEFGDCPSRICKQIIEIIKGKNAFVFEESFDTIKKKIDPLGKQNDVWGIHLHFSVKENHTNEINDIIKYISNIFKDNKVKISAVVKESPNSENKILLFVSYNKKEEKKDGSV